jgi:hypothetical protein
MTAAVDRENIGWGGRNEAVLMRCRMVLAVSAILFIVTPVRAKDCPVKEFSLDAREDAIRTAPTCRQALEIMGACAYGAGGDTGLSGAVRERCEPEFLPRLSKAQKRAYDRAQRRCAARCTAR